MNKTLKGYKLCKSCGQPMLKKGQKRKHPDDYRHARGCRYEQRPVQRQLSRLPTRANRRVRHRYAKLFARLGYGYSWDFNRREGTEWHELLDDSVLVVQIEMMVSVDQFVKDCLRFADEPTLKWETTFGYFVCGNEEQFREFVLKLKQYVNLRA